MRRLLLSLLLLASLLPLGLRAQDFTASERLYEQLRSGDGEGVVSVCNATMRQHLSAPQVSTLWKGLEMQFGALQRAGDWTEENLGAYLSHRRPLTFNRQRLELALTWAGDSLAGLFFRPLEEDASPAKAADAEAATCGREVELEVSTGKILLPATLLLPADTSEPVPCVVLVHGSGPSDRDETVGATKFFRQLADSLASHGIATLRYEKRTRIYGASTRAVSGGRLTYDEECADDALSALSLAASRPEVDASCLYVLGHSLGAMLMPRIAARTKTPLAGGIALAAPARKLPDILRDQLGYIASLSAGGAVSDAEIEAETKRMLEPLPAEYLKFDRKYDPVRIASRLSLPMLYLFAGNDYQVTAEDALLYQAALGTHQNVTIETLPATNHLFAPSPALARPADYQQPQRISTALVSRIISWVGK